MPAIVGDVYTYKEGSMDIQEGIDRQAKTLYKGEGVYQYMLFKGGGVTKLDLGAITTQCY